MGKRTDIDRRLRTLTEISAILRVMRTLAIMETGKLSRFLAAQTRVVESMEAAAADFLYFHPEVVTRAESIVTVRLMIGSERGFCGDFNEVVLRTQARLQSAPQSPGPVLMAIGSRLCAKISQEDLNISFAGACTVEEVQSVISRVIEELNNLSVKGALRLTVLYHGPEDEVITRTLQPFPAELTPTIRHSHAPILNLPPAGFYSELAGHYLFATVHEMFYQSLMADRQRQSHIDNAARRIDQKIAGLNLKKNVVRQEEIIEEIEILMLSAEPDFQNDSSADPPNRQGRAKNTSDQTAHSRQENI